jgi:hypothetical protein
MSLSFPQREFCLIIFLLFSIISLKKCASDDEDIDLRLTIAPPGHQLARESNIQLNDAQNKDQIIIDKSIQGAKHTKRKRRTKAEMQVSSS